jgi:hypothetical protein
MAADLAELLSHTLTQLRDFDVDSQRRFLKSLAAFLDIPEIGHSDDVAYSHPSSVVHPQTSSIQFSDRPDISPKEFILDKEPRTDVERVACLAYYLTHYLNKPHFKTLDISKLNTDAAQPKFSNATVAVDNATKMKFLVPAVKSHKQLGAFGEQYVRALPDREAAKAVRARVRIRRSRKLPKTGRFKSERDSD